MSFLHLPMQTVCRALIARGVLEKIKLVIVFGIPPWACRDKLGDNLLADMVEVLCLNFFRDAFRSGLLLWRVVEDCRAVL